MTRKDLFIDNNIAKNFSNPLDPEYKKLIKWLIEFNSNPKKHDDNAHLVVSQKLIAEYYRTMGHAQGYFILKIRLRVSSPKAHLR